MGGLLQVTRGGALTLASQWKSQFDDSEETTDNEWKPESPEHYRGGASHAGSTHQSLMPFTVNDTLGNAQTPKVSSFLEVFNFFCKTVKRRNYI